MKYKLYYNYKRNLSQVDFVVVSDFKFKHEILNQCLQALKLGDRYDSIRFIPQSNMKKYAAFKLIGVVKV